MDNDPKATPKTRTTPSTTAEQRRTARNQRIHRNNAATAQTSRAAVRELLVSLGGCCDCSTTTGQLEVELDQDEFPGLRFSTLVANGRPQEFLLQVAEAAHSAGRVCCAGCATRRRQRAAYGHLRGVDAEGTETRRCTRCGEVKPVSEFSWRVKSAGTRQNRCRPCKSAEALESIAARSRRDAVSSPATVTETTTAAATIHRASSR